jgi:hypothetical protein
MDYKSRAEQNKIQSEQIYHSAKLEKPENKSVQIGFKHGDIGRYTVIHSDGGRTSNGDKIFNSTAPQDGFIRGNASGNAIALEYRNYVRSEVISSEEEIGGGQVKILLLDEGRVLIGGDRDTPEEIYVIPDGFGLEQSKISATGEGLDDWIVQLVLRKQVIIDAYNNRETYNFLRYYLENKSTFTDSLKILTITIQNTTEIINDGIIKQDIVNTFIYSESKSLYYVGTGGPDVGTGAYVFQVTETYEITVGSEINQEAVSRSCDIVLTNPSDSNRTDSLSIRDTILSETTSVCYWDDLVSSGLSASYGGVTLSPSFSDFTSSPSNGEWILLRPSLSGHGWIHSFQIASLTLLAENPARRFGSPSWKYAPLSTLSPSPDFYTDTYAIPDPAPAILPATHLYQGRYYGSFFSLDGESSFVQDTFAFGEPSASQWRFFPVNGESSIELLPFSFSSPNILTVVVSDRVKVNSTGILPTPLTKDIEYFVRSVIGADVELSLTNGGTPITLLSAGTGIHFMFKSVSVDRMFNVSPSIDIDVTISNNMRVNGGDQLGNHKLEVAGQPFFLGLAAIPNTSYFLQGVDKTSQLLKIGDEYRLYKGDTYTIVIPAEIIGFQNLIDDVVAQVLAVADESVEVKVFQLLPTAQPAPETQTIDISPITDNGAVLSASAYQTNAT